jgi:hypothetical protein
VSLRIAPLALAVLASCAHTPSSAASPAAGMLVGMWRLVGAKVVLPGGDTRPSGLGESPSGFMAYDRSGTMAVQIRTGTVQPWEPAAAMAPIAGEPVDAGQAYLAYAGTWTLDAGSRTVVHLVEISLDPSLVGKEVIREVAVEGDQLVLTVPWRTPAGEPATTRLTWRRAG